LIQPFTKLSNIQRVKSLSLEAKDFLKSFAKITFQEKQEKNLKSSGGS
jgi:hypothetical protein